MQLVSVANVSFSCPGLQLNIRDGVRAQDTLLYTLREDTRVTVAVRSSRHVARLELVADTRDLNTSHCYAVMHVSVLIEGEQGAHRHYLQLPQYPECSMYHSQLWQSNNG